MPDAGYEIGWWIESADEEVYGPASRETIQRFLREGVISRNTLVRHCTQAEARPVVDHPGMTDGVPLDETNFRLDIDVDGDIDFIDALLSGAVDCNSASCP